MIHVAAEGMARAEKSGMAKVTRADGTVEYQHLVEYGRVEYVWPDGRVTATFPAGTPLNAMPRQRVVKPPWWDRAVGWVKGHRWQLLSLALGAMLLVRLGVPPWATPGAIVWVDAGQAHHVDVMDPATRGAQTTTYYGAWGSGSGAPAVGDTALGTELAESRVATTVSQPAANTLQWLFEITASGNRTVNEAGVFTASSSGTMLIRLTLSTLNIETGDRVEFTVQLAFKDSSE